MIVFDHMYIKTSIRGSDGYYKTALAIYVVCQRS